MRNTMGKLSSSSASRARQFIHSALVVILLTLATVLLLGWLVMTPTQVTTCGAAVLLFTLTLEAYRIFVSASGSPSRKYWILLSSIPLIGGGAAALSGPLPKEVWLAVIGVFAAALLKAMRHKKR